MTALSEVFDRYSAIDEKLYMTLDESLALSKDLATLVQQSGFQPDKVIGIANGALLTSTIVAKDLDAPLEVVRIRRKGSRIKKRLAKYSWLRRLVSALYDNPVTRPILRILMDYFSRLDKSEDKASDGATTPKRILVVDDAIETGQTLQKVLETYTADAEEVRIAVISWSYAYAHKKADIKPDYLITKRIHHYPWSQNSPSLADYQAWLLDNKLQEWD